MRSKGTETQTMISVFKDDSIRKSNIPSMYFSTSIAMILTELVGVIAVLIDGIVTSRFLGADVYSGISLIKPFSSIVLMLAGFLSTGCTVVCSRLIGLGRKEESNEVFNLASFLALLFSVLLILAAVFFTPILLQACGVAINKYPELNPYMYQYLDGYIVGLPAIMLIHISGTVIVMDGGKHRFFISSIVLCAANITGDLLNALVFHGGAYGMGLATSVSYIIQMLVLLLHFYKKGHYFRFSPKMIRFRQLKGILRSGTPAMIRKLSGALRDILTNYINIIVSVSAVAIAAKGIQGDLFVFLFCIPTGLGRTLVTMAGIYYGANNLQGLRRLYISSFQYGLILSGLFGILAFAGASAVPQLYTDDPEIISLTAFSIRWMSVGLVFDTMIVLIQHYLQGIDNTRAANLLSTAERLIVPVSTAYLLGMLYGSKGVLAAAAISKMILFFLIVCAAVIQHKGLPKKIADFMFLPKDFGGKPENNFYAEIRSNEDAVRQSIRTEEFCLSHGTEKKKAALTALCVEEMATNIFNHAEKYHIKSVSADFHLYADGEKVYFSLMDLSDAFDPTAFYEIFKEEDQKKHIGIRMVLGMASGVRYFRAYSSNNLIVHMD